MKPSNTFSGVVLLAVNLLASCTMCRGAWLVVDFTGLVLDGVTGYPVWQDVCLQSPICNCCGIGQDGKYYVGGSSSGPFLFEMSVRARNYAPQEASIGIESSGTYVHDFLLTPVDGTPIVDAGPAVAVVAKFVPWSLSLQGSAKDPDLWPNESAKPQWSVLSAPDWVDFDRPHDPQTQVTFSVYGSYVLQLSLDDGECERSDTVTITVNEPTPAVNHAPVAEAGGPYTGLVGESITLDGSGSHDDDGDVITYEWDLDNDGQYDDATDVIVQHTWNAPFSGSIGLRVTDTHGLTDTDTATATFRPTRPRDFGNECIL